MVHLEIAGTIFQMALAFFQIILILKLLFTIPPTPVVDRALTAARSVIHASVSQRSSDSPDPSLDITTGVEQ